VSTALLAALVDDAGLFPPEQLAMVPALRRHAGDVAVGHPVLSHRFLCPTSRVAEALAALGDDERLDLALVADTGVDGVGAAAALVAADARVSIVAVECRLGLLQFPVDLPRLHGVVPPGAAVWVESGWGDDLPAALAGLARDGTVGAKLRCGGVTQELFPSSRALAGAVQLCARLGLPWKATAGLHRAVRYTDRATGLRHHGYLNLLLAAASAADGAGTEDLVAVLDSADGVALVAQAIGLGRTQVARARAAMVSYGSCSTSEPADEAVRLGLAIPVARV